MTHPVLCSEIYVLVMSGFRPKEGPPITSSKNISVRARPPLKKADIPSRKESSDHVEDIDKEDKEDIFLLGEYVNDIYDYLREIEVRSRCVTAVLLNPELQNKNSN